MNYFIQFLIVFDLICFGVSVSYTHLTLPTSAYV